MAGHRLLAVPGSRPLAEPPDVGGMIRRRWAMSALGWSFTVGLYLVLLFTLAVLSFRKGHWVLGLVGFVFPVLWLVGAVLPDRHARR
jgi:hypothetical protein